MIPESQWKWFGNAGHFICARDCVFHLCTQVGPYLVSTVGQYISPRSKSKSGEFTEIGYNRLYKTMVFHAGKPCVSKDCDCGMPTPSDWSEIAMQARLVRRHAAI